MRRTSIIQFVAIVLAFGVWEAQAGALLRVSFSNIPGTDLGSLTNLSYFPNGSPAGVDPTSGSPLFTESITTEMNVDDAEFDDDTTTEESFERDYGTFTRGYLEVPETGEYRFFVASDDASAFHLSTDHNPANVRLIAYEPGCCTATFTGARLDTRASAPIELEKNKRYYFEWVHKEGRGGSWQRVGWERPDGVQEIIPGRHFNPFPVNNQLQPEETAPSIISELPAVQQRPIPNAGQPADVTIEESGTAIFFVTARVSEPATYQWKNDGVDIPGANGIALIYENVPLSEDSSAITVTISNALGSVTSNPATLTVTADQVPPTVANAGSRGNPGAVTVTFSEGVDPVTAGNKDNYTVAGMNITSATLQGNDRVLLTVDGTFVEDQEYTLTVSNIKDRSVAEHVIDPNPTTVTFVHGIEFRERIVLRWYDSISGTALSGLTGNAKFPNNPDGEVYPELMEGPTTRANNYGSYMFGVLVPPVTGDYVFGIAGDDQTRLNLSTDENPAGIRQIAGSTQWTSSRQFLKYASAQISAPVTLEGGKRYYIEALHKEGGGGDNFSVTWQKPGDPAITDGNEPISEEFFAPTYKTFAGNLGPMVITDQPDGLTVAENATATFSVVADGSPIPGLAALYQYQWKMNGVDIAGANGPTYTTPRTRFEDHNNAVITVEVSNEFSSVTSEPVTLIVEEDTTAPTIVSAGSVDGQVVGVAFNELLDPATATVASNYSVSGATVTGVTLLPDETRVSLTLGSPIVGAFTVTVNNVQDRGNNPIAANSSLNATVSSLTGVELERTASDPALPGEAIAFGDGAFRLRADGSDFWNEADAGYFIYEPIVGNFDLRVRIESLTRPDHWTKAGIMARTSTAGNSGMAMVIGTPPNGRNGYVGQERLTDAGSSQRWRGTPSEVVGVTYPNGWIRLRRVGDLFVAYHSTDGVNWTAFADTERPDLPVELLVGLALTSHSVGNLATAELREYSSVEHAEGTITFTKHPESKSTLANANAVLTVDVDASGFPKSEVAYRFERSDDNGATWQTVQDSFENSYTTAFLSLADDGVQYRVVASAGGVEATSNAATIDVAADNVPPTVLYRADGDAVGNTAVLTFSERLDKTSAETIGNYAIQGPTGALTVNSATLLQDETRVMLSTAQQEVGARHSVTVTGVKDIAGNAISANNTAIFYGGAGLGFTDGFVVFEAEHYTEKLQDNDPAEWVLETSRPGYSGEGYMTVPNGGGGGNVGSGALLNYEINFPAPGTYVLWVRAQGDSGSDDSVYVGLDGVRIGPDNRAAMSGFNNANWVWRSDLMTNPDPVILDIPTAGKHILGIWHREDGARIDKFLITDKPTSEFSLQNETGPGPDETPLQGLPPSLVVGISPADGTVLNAEGDINLSATVQGNGDPITLVEFFVNGEKLGEDTEAPYAATITGAVEGSYDVEVVATDAFGTTGSATANVTVDVTAPTVVSAASFDGTDIGIQFSEPVARAGAETASNYQVDGGSVQVLSATLRPSGAVELTISGTVADGFIVTVSNLEDVNGVAMTGSQAVQGVVNGGLTAVDIGTPGTDPLEPGSTISSAENQYDVIAGGSDFWNAADGGHFIYEQKTGDFDVVVAVDHIEPINRWSKAGLMVRESLSGDSRNLTAVVTPEGPTEDGAGGGTGSDNYEANYRPATGLATKEWEETRSGLGRSSNAHYPNAWVRLKRVGDTFSAYRGRTGHDWALFAQMTVDPSTSANGVALEAYPATVFVGMAVTAHNNNANMETWAILHGYGDYTVPEDRPTALYLAGSHSVNESDELVIQRLVELGFEVIVTDDDDSETSLATGVDLIVNSSTVNSGTIGTKYRDLAIPVINWEQANQDEFGLTPDDGAFRGEATGQTSLIITQPNHPLAAGLGAGEVTVTTEGRTFTWGQPEASATVVATLADNRPSIYVYEAGAVGSGGFNIPARRIHLFFQNSVMEVVTAEGLALFDAAVAYATGAVVSAPELSIGFNDQGQLEVSWNGNGQLQQADSLTNPNWTDVTGATSPHVVTPEAGAKFYRVVE